MCLAAAAAGADGLLVEVHPRPAEAASDRDQQIPPEEFAGYREAGREMGFAHVEAGPLVRSSYHADDAHR